MRVFVLLLLFLSSVFSQDKYMDNHSCNECHEKIYEEYQSSSHSKGYFNNELHRNIADKVSGKKYECATCHMPMADNLKELIEGTARPDKTNKTHTDAISCYFCHTIAYVKNAHKHNINTKARQAENYKPTLYGRLENPDDSDKHSSSKNPVYGKKVCMGCHAHKLNENNVTIFKAMDKEQESLECINCHMPELSGGAEKMDKRARGHHASHKFLGIYDKEFRATGIDMNISTKVDGIEVVLTNKMAHPLIIQPARVKYLEVKVLREGKEIWKNYINEPSEDREVFFEYRFKDREGKKVIIPAKAYSFEVNNLEAKESKTVSYKTPRLQKGDVLKATMFVRFAKNDCQSVVMLTDEKYKKANVLKEITHTIEKEEKE
ncbi:cytochrome c family protein [bacterium]|nr:cytochrome c family protein [bacterium]MBU1957657.1 cytochrome c family protein [bacterium]